MTQPRQLLHGATILIVAGRNTIPQECLQLLRNEGWRVEEVDGVERGLKRLQQTSPEVVLVDLKIGTPAGMQAIEKIREIDRTAVVLVIADDIAEKCAKQARRRGVYRCLGKPLKERDLFEALSDVLLQYCVNLKEHEA